MTTWADPSTFDEPLPRGRLVRVGALEIGGSHVCAALVDPDGTITGFRRLDWSPDAPRADVHAAVAEAAGPLRPHAERWAAAIPGPFHVPTTTFGPHPAGKLPGLAGRDLDADLGPLLGVRRLTWLNDAHAFGLGRALLIGSAGVTAPSGIPGPSGRLVALTLGSGIGSAFVADGRVLTDGAGVPPGGEVYALPHGATTLEGALGPAAMVAGHGGVHDVAGLCELARRSPETRARVQAHFHELGTALAPTVAAFSPAVVSVGGSVARSWDVFGAALVDGLGPAAPARVDVVPDTERSALVGAAAYARR